ncbi:MAG: methyltransferase [Mediterranea sp.]|jgi:tRNA1Val (adenine37-N6)-methyltransferase|nr:methyltransferase [Mediterranea sp.]
MSNPFFHFKQFTIRQDECAMKVGTDGVLLGAWAPVECVRRILDVGTGTGLIALMLAQRSPAFITALEIDKSAACQAGENVRCSPWNDRIEVVCTDFRTFMPKDKYDLIVSNPPYFVDSLLSPDKQRSIARHDYRLSYLDLIQGTKQLLSPQGMFAIIIPTNVAGTLEELARLYGLFPFRRLDVVTKPGGEPKRTLLAFSFFERAYKGEMLLTETSRHQYSEEYIALTKEYYIH